MNKVNDLIYLSATEALQLFTSKALSPVELMTAVIEHAQEVEPKINAFSETLFENALKQAKEAEKIYRDNKAAPRPLEGLPVALKDEHFIKGMLASEGSLLMQGFYRRGNPPYCGTYHGCWGDRTCKNHNP